MSVFLFFALFTKLPPQVVLICISSFNYLSLGKIARAEVNIGCWRQSENDLTFASTYTIWFDHVTNPFLTIAQYLLNLTGLYQKLNLMHTTSFRPSLPVCQKGNHLSSNYIGQGKIKKGQKTHPLFDAFCIVTSHPLCVGCENFFFSKKNCSGYTLHGFYSDDVMCINYAKCLSVSKCSLSLPFFLPFQ